MPKYPGISPYDNEKGTLGTAKKRWEKLYVKEIESDTVSGMEAEIENLATTAENSVSAAVSAKNDAVAAKTAAQAAQTAAETAAAGIQSVVETDVDNTLTIPGVAADAKVTGDWLRDIAKPVTLNTSLPETAYANEYMKVTTDSEGRVLYGVKRDGTFTWQKGVPKPIVDKIKKNIDNTLTKAGKPADAKAAGDWLRDIGNNIQNSEYIYCMTDSEQRILFGVRVDGSFVWPKGTPAHAVAEISNKLQKDSLHNSANIFKKICCCGDSYTEGYIVRGDGTRIVDNSYSWPHYIETMTGNKWVNCGVSGATVLSWQTNERGLAKATSEGLVQAYMIGLGLNDCWRELPVGTHSDIGTEAETYYGGMSAIVSRLHQISPSAKIFLFTMPEHGEAYIPYNNAVRDIVKYYRDNNLSVHCIDLQENQALFEVPQIISDRKGGHYTAIGYACFAKIIFNLLSEYIDSHVSEFQDVAFIEYSNS